MVDSFQPECVFVAPTTALCRFFVLGKCRYGSRCTFSHELPAQVSECADNETENLSAAASLVNCPFYLRGNCKYGEYCRLKHNPALLPDGKAVNFTHSASIIGKAETFAALSSGAAIHIEAAVNQQDFTCGICFDDIVQSGKHFGLLRCDHCFCLECLRSWRQSKDMELEVIRACPACRLPSDFIVPSLIFVAGEEKDKVVEAYKSHLALRECKYFTGLLGSCPFGPRCFYAHRDSEGQDVKHLDCLKRSLKPRRRRNGLRIGNAAQHILQRHDHLFHFFDVPDWDGDDLGEDLDFLDV